MNEFDNQRWIGDARALLDESAQALDAATLSRLNRARQVALEQRQRRRRGAAWFAATGLAGACALLLAVGLWQRNPADIGSSAGAPTVLAAAGEADAAAEDSIEFYQNLEFYAWLDAQDQDIDG